MGHKPDSDKVTPSVLSESDQEEETNMRIQQDIKEEEIPVNISDSSDKVTPSDLSESDQEKETNMRSPREIKEEEIPVHISKGPLDVRPPVVSKVEQEDLNIRDQQQVKEEESPGNIREEISRVMDAVDANLQRQSFAAAAPVEKRKMDPRSGVTFKKITFVTL
ncbi:uncharacterized protein O3C94_020982 [Discoglossus pictus]